MHNNGSFGKMRVIVPTRPQFQKVAMGTRLRDRMVTGHRSRTVLCPIDLGYSFGMADCSCGLGPLGGVLPPYKL